MNNEYIKCRTIDLPDEPLSPINVLVEVSSDTKSPSEIQLRRINNIQLNLPHLWNVGMVELQRYFDERLDNRGCARDGIREAVVAIHQPSEDETDENFFWNLAFVVKEDVPEQYWEVHFNGLCFDMVILFR